MLLLCGQIWTLDCILDGKIENIALNKRIRIKQGALECNIICRSVQTGGF